ncbi:major facilitator superfamily domain-containing protein [Mycotypha africana]|uniref:major facilitator superfamily domain-containing protein n=1 Tax=Mycotypha africana TaxID=64632 RepID=UPI0023018113|nr:major facilitator superfamily domain-containing protein [Mycotypha africana]KAI8979392.1 major facilitator superfamily domain-containing protein [Mycotypha africana]
MQSIEENLIRRRPSAVPILNNTSIHTANGEFQTPQNAVGRADETSHKVENSSYALQQQQQQNDQLPISKQPTISSTANESIEEGEKKQSIFLTFFGLQLALFLSALDGTIVATCLPRIGSDFNATSIVAWVATAYILTFDAFQPMFARLSDIFGRKWVLIFGIVVFLIGSLLCAVAKNMIWLIICRAIAGIGGAGIFSMVFIIVADIVPLEKRGNYQGLVNAVFALASVFGPLIGGSFTDYVTWRWNFYINLPIGAVALAVILFCLKLPVPKGSLRSKLKRIDYIGTILVLSAATLFLLAMNFGGQTFPWNHPGVVVPLVLVVVLIGVFIWVEHKVPEPLMPLRLFRNRSVSGVLASNWFFGITFFSVVYYLPVYFQIVRADTAMWSGIRLFPMQMLISCFSTGSGIFISKFGIYKPLMPLGLTLLTLATGLFALYDETTNFSEIYGTTVIAGAGLGFMFSSSIIAIQAAVDNKDIAIVTGLANFSRLLGGALGVAISSAVLNSTLAKTLPQRLPPPLVQQVLSNQEFVQHGLPAEYFDFAIHCFVDALKLNWYIMLAMSAVACIISFVVKNNSIKKESAPSNPDSAKASDNISSRKSSITTATGMAETGMLQAFPEIAQPDNIDDIEEVDNQQQHQRKRSIDEIYEHIPHQQLSKDK